MVDTIVIGNDISSLIAAVVCCRKGMQTLLISDRQRPVAFSESGYTFNMDPLPWSGLSDGDLCLHSFFKEMLHHPAGSLFSPLNPALQVILPEHRLDIYSAHETLFKEMEREFRGSRPVLETFYDSVMSASRALVTLTTEFPSLRPFSMRSSPHYLKLLAVFLRERARFLKKWATLQDDSLLRLLEAQMAFLSGYCDDGAEKAQTSPFVLSIPFQGLYYPRGGKQVLVDMLKNEMRSLGGSTIEGCQINGVTLGPGRCHVEWRCGDDSADASAERMILSARWENIDTFLSGHKRLKSLSNRLKRTEKSLHSLTLHMGIFDQGLPDKIAEYVILATPIERSLRDQSILFLELSMRGDIDRAPEGKRALSATVFMNSAPSVLSDEELHEMASKLLQTLKGFLPFLDDNLDFFDLERCLEIARTADDTACRRYVVIRNPFSPFSGVSNKTPLRNVVLTGGSLLAGLGFAGEILSGINAANVVSGGHAL